MPNPDPGVQSAGAAPDPPRPGTYALILSNDRRRRLAFGRSQRKVISLKPGFYVYVGSALGPGGIRARVARHCHGGPSRHWHIDYLRLVAKVDSVWYRYGERRLEHEWADTFSKLPGFDAVPGFGCSDCHCLSHLFFNCHRPLARAFAQTAGISIATCSCTALDQH